MSRLSRPSRRASRQALDSLRRWHGHRAQLLGALLGGLAILAVGGILAEAGHSLPSPRAQQLFRFCNGKCLCDGGVTDASLMQRICPEGWREVYRGTKQKVLKRRRELRREQIRRQRKAAPEPALWPSV